MSETNNIESIDLAQKAINHVLTQIKTNPNLRYHMGAFTQSYELLKAAHAALNGIAPECIDETVLVAPLNRPADATIIRAIKDAIQGESDQSASQKLAIISNLLGI